MKRTGIAASAAVLLLAAGMHSASAAEMKWAPAFDKALSAAKSGHKLVMVDFYTDWCGWCKKLDAEVYTDPKVVSASGDIVPVKVNAEKEGIALAKKYHISGFPTIVFLNGDGEVEGRVVGYEPVPTFVKSVSDISAAHRDYPALADTMKRNPDDAAAASKLFAIYGLRQDTEGMASTLEAIVKSGKGTSSQLQAQYAVLADAYMEKGEFAKAESIFGKVLAGAKTPAEQSAAHMNMARLLLNQNKIKAAIPELEFVVKSPASTPVNSSNATRILKIIHDRKLG